ncbi:MAG: BamA/TamA family outer membrane protein [Polyangiaceae bacterium]
MSIEGVGSQTPRRLPPPQGRRHSDVRLSPVPRPPPLALADHRVQRGADLHQQTIQQYLENGEHQPRRGAPPPRARRKSQAFAQRLVVTWDRRSSSFNPRHGILRERRRARRLVQPQQERRRGHRHRRAHTLRFTETFAGYVPVGRRLTFAAEDSPRVERAAHQPQRTRDLPRSLVLLGKLRSMRAWYQNTFIPQESMDKIRADARNPNLADADRLKPEKLPIRGGNLMINPKAELRIPLGGSWETVAFADIGNLWGDPSTPFDSGRFPIRAAVGSGIRYQTPIGPAALDYGINVTRYRPEEDFGAVQFSIGIF